MRLAAANVLPGAKGRLLPPSIPFAFFATALLFHILLWAALMLAADDIPSFRGGLGHALGSLHILTLGVLASTAMGAGFQLLPVATRQPLAALWPARAAFFLFVPGMILLIDGMGEGDSRILIAGGALSASGLVVYGTLVADNLRRARDLGVVALHGGVSIASLFLLLAAGLALAADFDHGFLTDHAAMALAHAVLGLYGFMGTLAMGFSYILVPMFALAEAPPKGWCLLSLGLWCAALVVAVGGALVANDDIVAASCVLALVAAIIHIAALHRVLQKRMRKRLGLSFVLLRASWGFVLASLVLGGLAALGLTGPRGPALFGVVATFGWLLTFLLGILQRILPFLGSMNAAKGGRPPLVSELTSGRALAIHAACHFSALAAVIVGVALDEPAAIRIGAAVGLLGAVAFAWFGAIVMVRVFLPSAPRPAVSTAVTER